MNSSEVKTRLLRKLRRLSGGETPVRTPVWWPRYYRELDADTIRRLVAERVAWVVEVMAMFISTTITRLKLDAADLAFTHCFHQGPDGDLLPPFAFDAISNPRNKCFLVVHADETVCLIWQDRHVFEIYYPFNPDDGGRAAAINSHAVDTLTTKWLNVYGAERKVFSWPSYDVGSNVWIPLLMCTRLQMSMDALQAMFNDKPRAEELSRLAVKVHMAIGRGIADCLQGSGVSDGVDLFGYDTMRSVSMSDENINTTHAFFLQCDVDEDVFVWFDELAPPGTKTLVVDDKDDDDKFDTKYAAFTPIKGAMQPVFKM